MTTAQPLSDADRIDALGRRLDAIVDHLVRFLERTEGSTELVAELRAVTA